MIRKRLTSCIVVFLLLWLASCGSNDRGAGTDAATYITDAPDYADVHNATHRANMDKEISRIAGYMGEAGDFYSPYYRHITMCW